MPQSKLAIETPSQHAAVDHTMQGQRVRYFHLKDDPAKNLYDARMSLFQDYEERNVDGKELPSREVR